jgi:hypothetical protein
MLNQTYYSILFEKTIVTSGIFLAERAKHLFEENWRIWGYIGKSFASCITTLRAAFGTVVQNHMLAGGVVAGEYTGEKRCRRKARFCTPSCFTVT